MRDSNGGGGGRTGGRFGRLILIGCLALILRLLNIHESASSPFFETPVIDARTYVEDALELAGGSWAGKPEPFWQPPLYTYFLALLFWAGGEDYYLPRLIQALLGAGSCILLFLIGERLFTPGVALGAGLAAACFGPLIYFGGELLPAIPAVFLNLLFFLSLIRPPCTDPWRWLLSGFLLGFAALAVANILLFLPFLVMWLWRNSRDVPRIRILQQSLLLLLGCVLAIAPVTARNYLVGGDWVLISHNAGINFYIGNNPDYERTVNIRPGRDWALLVEKPEMEAGIERPSAKSRYFFTRSWQFIADDPLGYLKLLVYKLSLFWRGDEIQRNLDPYFARGDSSVLRLLLWKYGLAFPFGLAAPLALLGLICFWRRPPGRSAEEQLLALFLLVYMVSVVLFFVTSRYRLPAVPFILLFAGYGLREMLGSGYRKKILLPLFGVLLVATNLGIGSMDMEGSSDQHYALGDAYEREGMQANALREYRLALERQPDHREARLRLAALHINRQEHAKAIESYHAYMESYPDALSVRFLLGNAYLAARRYKEAVAQYESLILLKPRWADLFGRLGYAYLMAENPSRAMWAYRRTLDIQPDSSLVRYQLARLYETQDSLQAAVKDYRILLQSESDSAEFHTRLANLLIEQEETGQHTFPLKQNARTHEAVVHLLRAVQLEPDNAVSRWSLGMTLAKQGRYVEAIEHFERVLELEPKNYQTHFCLANLYKRTGKEEKARQHMEHHLRASREKRLQHKAQQEAGEQIEKLFGSLKTDQQKF